MADTDSMNGRGALSIDSNSPQLSPSSPFTADGIAPIGDSDGKLVNDMKMDSGREADLRAKWNVLFDEIMDCGREDVRAEMARVLGVTGEKLSNSASATLKANGHHNQALEFGYIAGVVRVALDKYGRASGGIQMTDLVKRAQSLPDGRNLTSRQLRSAMKQVIKNNEA
ncbi:MAG TPA: hypothetical protein VHW69_15735, partial [Rhizomicrobium sp.]|nr:hypothetical protein [Rhizomicrobium sp.]